MKLTEEATVPDMKLLSEKTEQNVRVLRYDMSIMTERWLRTESRYDSILRAQKNNNIRTDIMIILQLFMCILLGVVIL